MRTTVLVAALLSGALPALARDAGHPAAPLADAIEARGCLFGEGDTADITAETDLTVMDVISMAPKLIADEHLIYEADNLQRLVNWGECAAS